MQWPDDTFQISCHGPRCLGPNTYINNSSESQNKSVGNNYFNCGENNIEGGIIDAQLCGTVDIGDRGSGEDDPGR